jgi:hypothetical protein
MANSLGVVTAAKNRAGTKMMKNIWSVDAYGLAYGPSVPRTIHNVGTDWLREEHQ